MIKTNCTNCCVDYDKKKYDIYIYIYFDLLQGSHAYDLMRWEYSFHFDLLETQVFSIENLCWKLSITQFSHVRIVIE